MAYLKMIKLKSIFLFLLSILTTFAYSQTEFTFSEEGLTPEFTVSHINSLKRTELYEKTLQWIETTYKHPNKVIDTKIENDFIQITSIRENVIQAEKRYFHLKYTVKISFKKGQYQFEPLKIQSKANSKYDIGWNDFNLKNGTTFFKKGKVIKKTKSYIKNIPAVLNKINNNLYNYLIKEN